MGRFAKILSFQLIKMKYQLVIDERIKLDSLIHDSKGDVCMDLLVPKHCR